MTSRRSTPRHPWIVGMLAVLTVLAPASPVLADTARPGDTVSTVDALEPAVEGVSVDVVGGDAFVRLRVEPGHEVVVPGYQGEPYLRVLADGTVQENERSPARVLNRDRYGASATELPAASDRVDADAPPMWRTLGTQGEVLWHDHRTHWMGRSQPPTISRDGLVQQWELPLEVDGRPVLVEGSIHLLDPPGARWWLAAVVGAVAALAVAWWGVRRSRGATERAFATAVALTGIAVAVTWWSAASSLPSVARPAPTVALLGLLALVCGAAAAVRRREPWSAVLLAGAGTALVTAAWLDRAVLVRAVVPGADPAWPMRTALAAGLGLGLAALAVGTGTVVAGPGAIEREPVTARHPD